jgi:hypothetical protein
VIEDAYRRTKYVDFWKIGEVESSVPVRKGVRSATQLLPKKHVKKQSRVSRLLEYMNK